MLEKLKLLRRKRLRKRTTFLKMFLKGMIIPILITVALGEYISQIIFQYVINGAGAEMAYFSDELSAVIAKGKISSYSEFMSEGYAIEKAIDAGKFDPRSWFTPKIRAVAFTLDSSGNIIDQNRQFMTLKVQLFDGSLVNTAKDAEDLPKEYYFDPQEYDLPEFERLFADAAECSKSNEYELYLDVSSAWLDDTEEKMIPKEMDVTIRKRYLEPFWMFRVASSYLIVTDTYHISVDYAPEGYVLTKRYVLGESPKTDPHVMEAEIIGCDPAYIEQVAADHQEWITRSMESEAAVCYLGGGGLPSSYEQMILAKTPDRTDFAGVFTYAEVVLDTPHAWQRLNSILSVILGAMLLFTAAVCAFRNIKNKARYAFEDYQRALTNNLAHDLKTPLAVIGGYAENLLMMRQDGSEKELEYLNAIMKNVAYTDELVRKTLLLNDAGEVRKLHRTETDLRQLADSLADKYRAALTERGIVLKTEGSGTVTADAELLAAVAENLITNAVKYTPGGGQITVIVSGKALTVQNSVAEDIDTKDLMMPYVKGDKTRNDRRSTGLGLSIAKSAAEQNGFLLKISCKNKVFTAALLLS